MSPRTGVLVFEGGRGTDDGASDRADSLVTMAKVRSWTTLDTVEKFLSHPAVDVVVLATDSRELGREAVSCGAKLYATGPGFHFGATLRALVAEHALDRAIYMGGGSTPLLLSEEMDLLLDLIAPGGRLFVANNAQSPDLVGLGSAEAVASLAALESDNATLLALTSAGYERRLLPETPTASFDLDTPSDVLFLAYVTARRPRPTTAAGGRTTSSAVIGRSGSAPVAGGPGSAPVAGRPGEDDGPLRGLGRRLAAGLPGLGLDTSVLERAVRVLTRDDYPTVSLIGRVSGSTMDYVNSRLRVRLRVFSEERGMKALGLSGRGQVKSLLASFARDSSLSGLVRRIASMSDAVFWDDRVLLSALDCRPGDRDRFESDLGRWRQVTDPTLRRFGRLVEQAGCPIVLGGHSVVAGGLRLLAWRLAEADTKTESQTPFPEDGDSTSPKAG